MNPVLAAALGAILRWALVFLAGYMVKAGIWTGTEADGYVAAAVLGLLGLGWSLWQKYKSRIRFLAALNAPAGTDEGNLDTRGVSLKSVPVILLAAVLSGALAWGGCAPKVGPNIGPAGKTAWQAKNVTDAAGTALRGIELLTDQGLLPKPTAVTVITAIRSVGLAGNVLADALRVYADSKGASGAAEIRTTIQNIQRLITDALILVPELDSRKRVQAILQPILDALAALLTPWAGTPTDALQAAVAAVDWPALVADAALARLN
jgi:hypothetical protein